MIKNYEQIASEMKELQSRYQALNNVHLEFMDLFLNMVQHNTTIENDLEKKLNAIEQSNKAINDSINYAYAIQTAILPKSHLLKEFLPDSFVYYRSKIKVSGDFYWFFKKKDKIAIAAVDCTGHGVPGAFMSVIGIIALNALFKELNIFDGPEILSQLDDKIRETLKSQESTLNDGMDIALCIIDTKKQTLEYSGAMRPLYMLRNNKLTEYKGDRIAIGGRYDRTGKFTSQKIDLQPNDTFYIFTDGFPSQLNNRGKQYQNTNFKQFLFHTHSFPMDVQADLIDKELNRWKEDEKQTDDVLVIGFRIS